MHLTGFEHFRPASMEEAAQMLLDFGPRARLVAGGTDLFPRIKLGLTRPEVVVSLKGISPKEPQVARNGNLHIHALTPLADMACSPMILEKAPLLAEAALSVGSNQIRHMGTLGGNICLENRCSYYNQSHTFQFIKPCFKRHGDLCYLIPKGKKCLAVFMADTIPALICLDASVEIVSPGNARQVAVEKLYTGNALQPLALSHDEIVREVIIPNPAANRGAAFSKFSLRGGMEFAALTVAVVLDMTDKSDTCAVTRIAVGSVATRPVRAFKAEASAAGKPISDKFVEEIAHIAADEIQPVMHHGYSVPYLKECLNIQIFRTLALGVKRTGIYEGK
jgi:4-hydroxybenzoyl-CoA reductase beta subunit